MKNPDLTTLNGRPEDDLEGRPEDQADGDHLGGDGGDEGEGGHHLYQDHPSCTSTSIRIYQDPSWTTWHHPVGDHLEGVSPHGVAPVVELVKLNFWVSEEVEAGGPQPEI